jgi:hypothetical protein
MRQALLPITILRVAQFQLPVVLADRNLKTWQLIRGQMQQPPSSPRSLPINFGVKGRRSHSRYWRKIQTLILSQAPDLWPYQFRQLRAAQDSVRSFLFHTTLVAAMALLASVGVYHYLPLPVRRIKVFQVRDTEDSDVFILSGSEDLVPLLEADRSRFRDSTSFPGHYYLSLSTSPRRPFRSSGTIGCGRMAMFTGDPSPKTTS